MNLIGSTIKGYKFIGIIGNGSFGTVYKTIKNNTFFAAKLLDEAYVQDQFLHPKNRITVEIDSLKKVNDSRLIKYIEDFTHSINEVAYYMIIMEYFDGIKFDLWLKLNNTPVKKMETFLKVAEGVKALHSFGIIHRDIKPDNILVNDKNEVKIIDYGLSKIINYSAITRTGDQIGSPIFMSPEQIKDSKRVDFRSDIYSLGVILYYMITLGKYPYEAETLEELFHKILNSPITPPKAYNDKIIIKVERAVYKSLSKEIYNRFQRVDDLINALLNDYKDNKVFFQHKFYCWMYNEFKVFNEFDSKPRLGYIFPIHLKDWQKGLGKELMSNKHEVLIDPSTHRLSYPVFSTIKGLRNLSYSPEKGAITLSQLNNISYRRDYLQSWYEEIQNQNNIIYPYHYINNTEYTLDKSIEWIKVNIQLINEANILIENKKTDFKGKYAMISVSLEYLSYEEEVILSYYCNVDVNGYILLVSNFANKINVATLKSYVSFATKLQNITGKPVILLKVHVAIGLYMLTKGIHGFSTGISKSEGFNEESIKSEVDAFNINARYYFKDIMSMLSFPRKDSFTLDDVFQFYKGCDCKYCRNKSFAEITTEKDRLIQLHFLEQMRIEIEAINNLNESDKDDYFKKRLLKAISDYRYFSSQGYIDDGNYNKKVLEALNMHINDN